MPTTDADDGDADDSGSSIRRRRTTTRSSRRSGSGPAPSPSSSASPSWSSTSGSCCRRPASGASRSTTSSSPGRPGWARRRWPGSWPPRWAPGSASPPGPVLTRAGDLAALLTDLQDGDVLFIDEIHRLHRSVEEMLYSAMEDGRLDILIGKGPTARSIRLDLPQLHAGRCHDPHRTRVGPAAGPLRLRRPSRPLRPGRPARHRGAVGPHPEGAASTPRARSASRSAPAARRGWPTGCCAGCGTSPRCAARASSTAPRPARASSSSASTSWAWTRSTGPSWPRCARRFGGQPVGLTTLAQCVGEEPDTIEDAYEPYPAAERADPAHGPGPGGHPAGLGAPGSASGPPIAPPAQRTRLRCSDGAADPRRSRSIHSSCARQGRTDALPFSGRTTRRKRGDQMAGMTTRRADACAIAVRCAGATEGRSRMAGPDLCASRPLTPITSLAG